MAKHRTRTAKSGTDTAATHPDPVVDLSRQLLDLWDANDASEVEYSTNDLTKPAGREVQQQLDECRGRWPQ